MSQLSLVTGANGHLGNNLVRLLIAKGKRVRAGVRNLKNTEILEGLDCETVYAEMTDPKSMYQAMEKVDVLYHVAAVFKHWSKNPDNEIIKPNVQGTEVVLEAAHRAGVKKVVYVSSVAAVGHDGSKLNELNWNDEETNAYYRSKILSEQKAWQLAEKYKLHMVSVLPSAMIGRSIDRLTDTMIFLESVRTKTLPIDPNFFFNFVDVQDVAEGIFFASGKGIVGQRYILANEHSSSLEDILNAARKLYPAYQSPPRFPKWALYCAAFLSELKARALGTPADLMRSQVELFYGVKQEYDISKARRELGYAPRPPEEAIVNALRYLTQKSTAGVTNNLPEGLY